MTDAAPTLSDAAHAAAVELLTEFAGTVRLTELLAIAYMRGNVAGCREALSVVKDTRFDRSMSEALNSGDGSYRP